MAEPKNDTIAVSDFEGNSYHVSLSKLQWRPSAYGIVIKDDKILLLRQANGYDLPGGGLELGETPEEAVVREVREETGAVVNKPQLVGVGNSFYIAYGTTDNYRQAIMMYYLCNLVSDELSTDGFDEHEQMYAEEPEWVLLDKLPAIKLGSTADFRPYIKQALKL